MPDDERSAGTRVPIGLMVVGSEMACFTVLGLIADYLLDTMPGLTLGFTLLGLGLAFYHLVKISTAMSAKKPTPPSPPTPENRDNGENGSRP